MKRKKIVVPVLFLALVLMVISAFVLAFDNESTLKFAKSLNLSEYKTLPDNSSSNKIIVDANKSIIKELDGVTDVKKTDNMYFLTFDSVKSSDKAYEKLRKEKISVNKDLKVKIQTEVNEMPESIKNNKKGVKVAVIDSGVNGADTSLDVTGEGVSDLSGHGTLIANIIEDVTDNGADIISIKAFDKDGNGSIATLYSAVKLAIENDVDIINLSATTGYKVKADCVVDAIKEATDKGIKVVCAAGNYSADTKDFATANIKEADVVSAVNEDGSFADYSNYGSTVDYSALGTYKRESGTSIATACVTAYMIKYGNDFNNKGIDLGDKGYDVYYGNGTYGVNVKEGNLPKDGFESVIFHDDWKGLSDEEFRKAVYDAKESYLSVWLNSLSREDLRIALMKDSILNWNRYEYDNGKVSSKINYAEYLMSLKVSDVSTMAILDKKSGFYNLRIFDYGTSETSQKTLFTSRIAASVSSTDNIPQKIKWSVVAQTNTCNFVLTSASNSAKTENSTENQYTIFPVYFSYTKPGHRYADSERVYVSNKDKAKFDTDSTLNNGGVHTTAFTETLRMKINAKNLGINATSDGKTGHGTYTIKLHNPKLIVSYDNNGGTGAPSTQSVYYNSSLTLSSTKPKRNGRKFIGWGKSKTDTTSSFSSGASKTAYQLKSFTNGTKFTENKLSLFALWDYYWTTVKFYKDSVNLDGTAYITYDNTLVNIKYTLANQNKDVSTYNSHKPTKAGAKFVGWNTKYDGSGDTVITSAMLSSSKLNVTGVSNSYWKSGYWQYSNTGDKELVLYPKWQDKKANITYDANSNEVVGDKTKTFKVSSMDETIVKINMFTRDGYILKDWNTKADGSGTSYKEGQSMGHYPDVNNDNNEDITLYAQWVKADYYRGLQFRNIKSGTPPKEPEYTPISEEYGYYNSVNIFKKDTENIPVPNVTFDVECDDGSITTVTTDENGNALAEFEFSVSTEDYDKTYYYCSNYDELDESVKQQVAESGYYLTENEARADARKDLKSYVKDIEKKYTIKEVKYPDYVLPADDITITLKGEDASQNVTVIDSLNIEPQILSGECTLTPVFKIRKINKQNEILPGVKINIYSDKDKKNLLVAGTTDDKGEITYEGTPVTYRTKEYKYVDVVDYGEVSDRLKAYCKSKGYYTSYSEAMEAYKQDANYDIVQGRDENGSLSAREKEMERTYYYQELEALDGYKLDNTLHEVTVFWYKSNDVNNNIITNADKKDEFDAEADDDVEEGNGEVVPNGNDGEEVDYATKFINYQEYKLKEIEDSESFNQTLTLIKKGSLGNLLPNATFEITVDGVKKEYITDNDGKITITNTFNTKTENTYKYIENLSYVSDEDINNLISSSTDKEQIFKTIDEAKKAARKEVEEQREKAYHIHEVTPPKGYEACEDSDIVLKYNESKEVELTDKNIASIRIKKNDSEQNPMENAVFVLYSTVNNESEPYDYKGEKYYPVKEEKTDKNGEIIFNNLTSSKDVKYIIVEKITREGKTLLLEPINVGILPKESDVKPSDNYNGTVVNMNDKYYYYDVTYTVTNDNTYELPKTGANIPYVGLLGIVIALAGSIFLIRKKEEKRINE